MNKKYIIVTGGAGFIGSCFVRTLNDNGIENIIIVDNIATTEKWKNLRNKKYYEYVHKNKFIELIKRGEYNNIYAIVHLGACSSTTQIDFDYLWNNNVEYTKILWKYCSEKQISFIYASSAATYGIESNNFSDCKDRINFLYPLNAYGYSKQAFDQWSIKQYEKPLQYVGLKFFNVYGPNEYFKGDMASMAFHGYRQLKEMGKICLFHSENKYFRDGEQKRDFIYVKDVCNVILYFLKHPQYNGIFNVGTGHAHTFIDLASTIFHVLNRKPNIEFFDMPQELKSNYQYYTEANISSLRRIGYVFPFFNLEEGIKDYVQNFLEEEFEIY